MLDSIIAGIGLLVLSPLFLVIPVLICLIDRHAPLFCQLRPGLHEKPFVIYKFKTMLNRKDRQGNLLPDEQRLTLLGAFLRKSSLDELPQLYNILIGQMSLVGPRPLLMEYLALYTEEEKLRHTTKPGLTGWAQIHGREKLSFKDKLQCDRWYVQNYSLKVDLYILKKTIELLVG